MTLYNKYYLNGNITKDEVIIATVISYNKGITAICNLINNDNIKHKIIVLKHIILFYNL